MILEFAALSRLSGEPVFEEKASQAMDVLWAARHRMSNLVGNVLNIQVWSQIQCFYYRLISIIYIFMIATVAYKCIASVFDQDHTN